MQHLSDLEFLSHPDTWGHWPWCPVKRDGVMGCVFWNESSVYLRNVFIAESLDGVEKVEYETLAALCEAGWRVD